MSKISTTFLAGVLALVLGGTAAAQNTGSAVTQGGDVMADVISTIEEKLIRDYFGLPGRTATGSTAQGGATYDGNGKGKGKGRGKGRGQGKGKDKRMPPGLAKREQLPPGLARRDTLPPGLQGRDLPPALQHSMPPRPAEQTYRVVGNDVVLIEKATGVVIDVLRNVLTAR